MSTYVYAIDGAYLMHHGIKGQHWGDRRYQNSDGSLTAQGLLTRIGDAKQHIELVVGKSNHLK